MAEIKDYNTWGGTLNDSNDNTVVLVVDKNIPNPSNAVVTTIQDMKNNTRTGLTDPSLNMFSSYRTAVNNNVSYVYYHNKIITRSPADTLTIPTSFRTIYEGLDINGVPKELSLKQNKPLHVVNDFCKIKLYMTITGNLGTGWIRQYYNIEALLSMKGVIWQNSINFENNRYIKESDLGAYVDQNDSLIKSVTPESKGILMLSQGNTKDRGFYNIGFGLSTMIPGETKYKIFFNQVDPIPVNYRAAYYVVSMRVEVDKYKQQI